MWFSLDNTVLGFNNFCKILSQATFLSLFSLSPFFHLLHSFFFLPLFFFFSIHLFFPSVLYFSLFSFFNLFILILNEDLWWDMWKKEDGRKPLGFFTLRILLELRTILHYIKIYNECNNWKIGNLIFKIIF